jgi:hypothetical protein
METQSPAKKHRIMIIGGMILAIITIGVYFFFLYKKAHSGIALQCGVMTVPLSAAMTALPRPNDLPTLNEFGCYEAEDGCACAKVTLSGQGLVFGVSKADASALKIPGANEDRTKFLASLGMFVRSNSATGTVVTTEMGMFKDIESVTVKSLGTDQHQKVLEARNIYFIYKDALININMESDQPTFATYWPDFEKSLLIANFK